MAKKKFHITSSNLKKLHKALKKYEEKNSPMLIGGIKLSNFLSSNVEYNIQNNNPIIETKQIILKIAGDFSTDPSQLANNINLINNLNYGNNEFMILQRQLDRLVNFYKKGSSVSNIEIAKCKTVGDCTKLVASKLN